MSIEGLAASYFTDWSVPTYKDLAFKGIKAFSFFTIICPIAIGLTWAGCALYNRISRCLSGNQEATSKKVTYVATQTLPISSDGVDKGQTPKDLPPIESFLPAFLVDLVQAKHIPLQEKEILSNKDMVKLDLPQPATVIVGKAGVGIALKLKIKHLPITDEKISAKTRRDKLILSKTNINSAEGLTLLRKGRIGNSRKVLLSGSACFAAGVGLGMMGSTASWGAVSIGLLAGDAALGGLILASSPVWGTALCIIVGIAVVGYATYKVAGYVEDLLDTQIGKKIREKTSDALDRACNWFKDLWTNKPDNVVYDRYGLIAIPRLNTYNPQMI